jgi:hypothetical protein
MSGIATTSARLGEACLPRIRIVRDPFQNSRQASGGFTDCLPAAWRSNFRRRVNCTVIVRLVRPFG